MFIVSTPAIVVVPAVTLEIVILTESVVPATAAAVYVNVAFWLVPESTRGAEISPMLEKTVAAVELDDSIFV
jgi:hypothetical protein